MFKAKAPRNKDKTLFWLILRDIYFDSAFSI